MHAQTAHPVLVHRFFLMLVVLRLSGHLSMRPVATQLAPKLMHVACACHFVVPWFELTFAKPPAAVIAAFHTASAG